MPAEVPEGSNLIAFYGSSRDQKFMLWEPRSKEKRERKPRRDWTGGEGIAQ